MSDRLVSVDENFDLPESVRDRNAEHLGDASAPEGMAVKATASEIITQKIKSDGIMTGHEEVTPTGQEDFAWRQTTEEGYFLPLGYTADLRLDEHARTIWREDVNNTKQISPHPIYAKVIVTEDSDLLLGIRWDGSVEIPGLASTGAPTPPQEIKPTQYSDSPFHAGSDVLPFKADPLSWSMWASSSGAGINGELSSAATGVGASYYNGGQGGEKSYHIAGRLGSVPALISFPDNTVPAEGTTIVTSSTHQEAGSASLRTYTGTVKTVSGNNIHGTFSIDKSVSPYVFRFQRTTAGVVEAVDPNVPFIPEVGPKRRGDTVFLWMGKNNTSEVERVIRETDASYDYLAPLVKRCMVLGHFVNTKEAASSSNRVNIKKINDAHAARYGRAYLDVNEYLISDQLWVDTGITPTEEDIAEQAIGNKPPSVSSDNGHLNAAGYAAVRKLIIARMDELGWLPVTKA